MPGPMVVNCPVCKAAVHWSPGAPYRPFCSQRCYLQDLGAWASEDYVLPERIPLPSEDKDC